ncbi:hypothetical protein DPMN_135044 [Dreissena polymorpha]|uniref:Uncharacterized protein n=1 Tax=Dreissena polymorpha TaxID=45954 RepID=A0A9D4JCG5_DREPO|nr:hypothetical protein DPMN_135044 [Dreissena polymorpha]
MTSNISYLFQASIDGDRLKLALEPEVAAVCCEALEHTLTGQKFMVVDIGGSSEINNRNSR